MKKIFIALLLFASVHAYSQDLKKTAPDVLVVVNGAIAGTMKDLREDLLNFPAELIQQIDVLKGEAATKKYGEKGKAGVIELTLKNAELLGAKGIIEGNSNRYAADSVFTKVDIEASFLGGPSAWRIYLERNIHAEIPSQNHAPAGTYTTITQFIVDKQGNISDVKALTNHGYGMEEEAVRAISKGPKWVPAIVDGRNVKAYRKQPITFQTTSDITLSATSIKAGVPTTIEISIDRSGLKPEEIKITLSTGTIKHESGWKYIITVDKPGKVLLTAKKTAKKKKDEEEYNAVAIEVK